jgi:hypothetical protein
LSRSLVSGSGNTPVIEVRAIDGQEPAKSAADVFTELGPWSGESTEAILHLLAEARRGGGRRPVPEL